MKLVTIQASAFKSTFEVLKDILNDVNIYFRPQGMYIVTLDTARTSLIDIFLAADNFEEYECTQEEIIAGINISNTFKLLKTITNNDVLKIEINSKEYMDIEISSEAKKTNTKFQLKLLDINENHIEVPDIDMTTITTLPSVDFQRLCRDMSNIGTDIEIRRFGNQIKLGRILRSFLIAQYTLLLANTQMYLGKDYRYWNQDIESRISIIQDLE